LLREAALAFGFGATSDAEIDDRSGALPDPASDPEKPWMPLVDAIGHGRYETNLLGLARAYAAIVNGGHLVPLHVTRAGAGEARSLSFDPRHLALVRGALTDAVEKDYGVAHPLRTDAYRFAGKTGSATIPDADDAPDGEREDGWFVAFTPPEDAQILVAGRLEKVRGGRDAANVVRRWLDAFAASRGSSSATKSDRTR
jgi:cell division protein FtsI/penicillin-binding protein 2